MKKAIVLCDSSYIGIRLAKILAKAGYILGITAPGFESLEILQSELSDKLYIRQMNISDPQVLEGLLQEMNGVDLIIVCACTDGINKDLEWQFESSTIDTNATGVIAVINMAIRHFLSKGKGHLVSISSTSSAFLSFGQLEQKNPSNSLQGLQKKIKQEKLNIAITNIKPAFVRGNMTNKIGCYQIMADEAVLYKAIKKKKKFFVT